MKWKAISGLLLVVVLNSSVISGAEISPALASFDEHVAQSRRVVRDYCAMVQQMAMTADIDRIQQEQALKLLQEAKEKWQAVMERYSANPPAEYAGDRQFKARLKDFDNALDDMERALAAGQSRRSMLACGFGCGLFVKLHEDNGLSYALDKLFHLRQTAKTAESVMKAGGLESLRNLLPVLMERRDQVLLSPAPWPVNDERSNPYAEAVQELSRTIDDLTLAVSNGDGIRTSDILQSLVVRINRPYTLAL